MQRTPLGTLGSPARTGTSPSGCVGSAEQFQVAGDCSQCPHLNRAHIAQTLHIHSLRYIRLSPERIKAKCNLKEVLPKQTDQKGSP